MLIDDPGVSSPAVNFVVAGSWVVVHVIGSVVVVVVVVVVAVVVLVVGAAVVVVVVVVVVTGIVVSGRLPIIPDSGRTLSTGGSGPSPDWLPSPDDRLSSSSLNVVSPRFGPWSGDVIGNVDSKSLSFDDVLVTRLQTNDCNIFKLKKFHENSNNTNISLLHVHNPVVNALPKVK